MCVAGTSAGEDHLTDDAVFGLYFDLLGTDPYGVINDRFFHCAELLLGLLKQNIRCVGKPADGGLFSQGKGNERAKRMQNFRILQPAKKCVLI